MEKTYSNKKEILRFIIVGIIATIFDYVTKVLVTSAIGNNLNDNIKTLIGYISGFLVSVIVNYILSTFFVFKNVKDEKKSKSFKSMVLFFIFSLIGCLIGLGIFYGCYYLFKIWNIDINNFSIFKFYESITNPEFYLYTLVFVVQTLIVLVFNYTTRKKFIYVAPKNNENNLNSDNQSIKNTAELQSISKNENRVDHNINGKNIKIKKEKE